MRKSRTTPRALGLVLLALLLSSMTALVPNATTIVAEARVATSILLQGGCTPEDQAFALPYTKYVQTQGPHGSSYGQSAYDFAAGAGAPILSTIKGIVTRVGKDSLNNTVLEIKNTCYEVQMLHGNYSVTVNQSLEIGNVVGTESNQGNTTGYGGKVCNNEPGCG